MGSVLDREVRYLKGIGEARAGAFLKLGIETFGDLITFYPRRYEDRSRIVPISDAAVGETVPVVATVLGKPTLSRIRKGLDLVRFPVGDGSGVLELTYFNQSYLKERFKVGKEYLFYGRMDGDFIGRKMTNPSFEEVREGEIPGGIVPVYRLSRGLSQRAVASAAASAIELSESELSDMLPPAIMEGSGLCGYREAVRMIHFPESMGEVEMARRRLVFDELLTLQLGLLTLKRGNDRETGVRLSGSADVEEFIAALPYSLTGAQRRAIDECMADMSGAAPMKRLIQGDVGSGKTVVAAALAHYVIKSGYQAAMMAPTEILATQHHESLGSMLGKFDISVGLLTGSMGAAAKREMRESIENGRVDLAIGTHALIEEAVGFRNLGLVIADEQHRFGVSQRAKLSAKGDSPHMLVMSATPIPRTLSLILYGDLDVSTIDEMPPGRQKVDTFLVGEEMRERIYGFVRRLVGEGRQVYVVCPLVLESENYPDELKNVTEYADELAEKVFPDLSVAFVHGRMRAKDKDDVMRRFSAGEIDVLVSTTVIEVGVNVPNAALMLIENAERFGLSQLHQLRGRVGRGVHKSYCVMMSSGGGEQTKERLSVMCETNDGFKIAEKDLEIRGPGDFFGSRQHGLPTLKIADMTGDTRVIGEVREVAKGILAEDPELANPVNAGLREAVRRLFSKDGGDILN